MDAVDTQCRMGSGIPPHVVERKKAHVDLPDVPEMARVRFQCLDL